MISRKRLHYIGAIDTRGFFHFDGNRHHKLAHEEDEEWAAAKQRANYEWIIRVNEIEVAPDEEGGDEGDDVGQHHGRKQQEEQDVSPGKAIAGKAVGHDSGHKDVREHAQDSDENRVEKEAGER